MPLEDIKDSEQIQKRDFLTKTILTRRGFIAGATAAIFSPSSSDIYASQTRERKWFLRYDKPEHWYEGPVRQRGYHSYSPEIQSILSRLQSFSDRLFNAPDEIYAMTLRSVMRECRTFLGKTAGTLCCPLPHTVFKEENLSCNRDMQLMLKKTMFDIELSHCERILPASCVSMTLVIDYIREHAKIPLFIENKKTMDHLSQKTMSIQSNQNGMWDVLGRLLREGNVHIRAGNWSSFELISDASQGEIIPTEPMTIFIPSPGTYNMRYDKAGHENEGIHMTGDLIKPPWNGYVPFHHWSQMMRDLIEWPTVRKTFEIER